MVLPILVSAAAGFLQGRAQKQQRIEENERQRELMAQRERSLRLDSIKALSSFQADMSRQRDQVRQRGLEQLRGLPQATPQDIQRFQTDLNDNLARIDQFEQSFINELGIDLGPGPEINAPARAPISSGVSSLPRPSQDSRGGSSRGATSQATTQSEGEAPSALGTEQQEAPVSVFDQQAMGFLEELTGQNSLSFRGAGQARDVMMDRAKQLMKGGDPNGIATGQAMARIAGQLVDPGDEASDIASENKASKERIVSLKTKLDQGGLNELITANMGESAREDAQMKVDLVMLDESGDVTTNQDEAVDSRVQISLEDPDVLEDRTNLRDFMRGIISSGAINDAPGGGILPEIAEGAAQILRPHITNLREELTTIQDPDGTVRHTINPFEAEKAQSLLEIGNLARQINQSLPTNSVDLQMDIESPNHSDLVGFYADAARGSDSTQGFLTGFTSKGSEKTSVQAFEDTTLEMISFLRSLGLPQRENGSGELEPRLPKDAELAFIGLHRGLPLRFKETLSYRSLIGMAFGNDGLRELDKELSAKKASLGKVDEKTKAKIPNVLSSGAF